MLIPHGARALRFATAVVLALGATACAKNAADDASIASAAAILRGRSYAKSTGFMRERRFARRDARSRLRESLPARGAA